MIKMLCEMQMDHVLVGILRYCDAVDLCKMSQVSALWNAVIVSDKSANLRRKDFLHSQKLNLVN